MKKDQRGSRRRWILRASLVALVIVAALIARPLFHLWQTNTTDVDQRRQLPEGVIDDASGLNATRVAEVWDIPVDIEDAEKQLSLLLVRAKSEGLKVSIAGARHSMGGHTIYPGGIAINMLPLNNMRLDREQNLLHVGAGALWEDIIPYLESHGRSVAVMQSNNSFSVGGSISVNCHGWQFNRPPIASTIESLRLMKADGTIVRCSRAENQELFSLVLGGYGLFGIILDLQLRVVPNERYRLEQHLVPLDESLAKLNATVKERPGARMVYARMNVTPDQMFREVIINAFIVEEGEPPPLAERENVSLRRAIFRGSVGSDYGKELRWSAETKLQPLLVGKVFSRNQLLNEGVEVFQNRSAESTDILHEYFVPGDQVATFVWQMRKVILDHDGDLLNVTVRDINEDSDTFLRYADQPIFAFVMLFNQPKTDSGEARMQAMTRQLIDSAIAAGGRYYLPYRLHATVGQFHQAYPQAKKFFELKLKYDPDELFQNEFYRKYSGR
jgi:FAD/FMN-containing dehydrogenase